jgi:hypothetical protein
MLKTLFLSFCAFALVLAVINNASGAPPRTVTFTGTAQDCFEGSVDLASGIQVSAFQLSRARPIKAHLDSMSQITFGGLGDDSVSFARLGAMYTTLQSMVVNNTKALARQTSATDGSFALTFSAVDSVLVVGYQPQEDRDFYYSSKLMTGQSNTTFVLDMSRGACGF